MAATVTAMKTRKSAATIKAAAAAGQRDLLVALRDKIADEIDGGVPARDLASLSLRLIALSEQIAAIDAEEATDGVGNAAATPDEAWDG